MGTRGLRVYRLKKRYYALYNHYDSYPEGLGKQIVAEIPSTPSEYQAWLTSMRAMVAEWEAQYEKFLTIGPGNEINSPAVYVKAEKNDEEEEGGEERNQEESEESEKEKRNPEYMEHQFPSYFAPVNDTWIEWIYTLDLDNEKFSVSNGAHFPLEQMPHIEWMNALEKSSRGTQIALPGRSPVMDLVATLDELKISDEFADKLKLLSVDESSALKYEPVTPKGLGAIPWNMRHGPILQSSCFYFWSVAIEEVLSSTLLQLHPSDILFRDLAFGILCLAAGGKNKTAVRKRHLVNNSAFGFLKTHKEEQLKDAEFFSILGSGAHREGERVGKAPEETTYWFEGVLIVLAAQLYRDGNEGKAIQQAAEYCGVQYPKTVVDAVVLSIEHVVLLHIIPASNDNGPVIQHSRLMPLFEIPEHLTMHSSDRYKASYLSQYLDPSNEKFQKRLRKKQREAMSERMIKSEGINMQFGKGEDESDDEEDEEEELLLPTQYDGSPSATFDALQHIFASAARRGLRPNQQGCFPTEVYERILLFVTDSETRDACLHTSLVLREICLKEYLVSETEGILLRPCVACEGCVEPGTIPKWWISMDAETGKETEVDIKRGGVSFLDWDRGDDWAVLVGHGYGERCLIPDITFKFSKYSGAHD